MKFFSIEIPDEDVELIKSEWKLSTTHEIRNLLQSWVEAIINTIKAVRDDNASKVSEK